MRSLLVAELLICLLSCGAASAAMPPEVEEMMPLLADLAFRGGLGNGHAEEAAFIVRRDGELRCELWPATGRFQQTSFTGVIPRGTVAIAHTHPRCCRDASVQDELEAQRLGIPVVVASMGSVSYVTGSDRGRRPIRGIRWSAHRDPARTCMASGGARPELAISSRSR